MRALLLLCCCCCCCCLVGVLTRRLTGGVGGRGSRGEKLERIELACTYQLLQVLVVGIELVVQVEEVELTVGRLLGLEQDLHLQALAAHEAGRLHDYLIHAHRLWLLFD